VIEAGCDLVLHCSGDLQAMKQAAAALGVVSDRAAERIAAALAGLSTSSGGGHGEHAATRDRLVAAVRG
jgi:beta-N-acetylhexosaminidase